MAKAIDFPTNTTDVKCDLHLYVFDKSKYGSFEEAFVSGDFKSTSEDVSVLNFTEQRFSVWEVQDVINTLTSFIGNADLETGILLAKECSRIFVPINQLGSIICTYDSACSDGINFESLYDLCQLAIGNPAVVSEYLGDETFDAEQFDIEPQTETN
ncbi:hypothetical protein FWP33_13310 [Vibrio parahaemolyticus]|jgi:hypothetical protein|uniref:Uncharacterized protein n=2 Tax=Vibrio harveyi group TaxID=717610 RepID=A0A9Q3YG61_VIBPH|nr:hypothetical protein [Vibrio parahaemolyticus]CAH1598272.1 hypothetical protein THF1C08_50053 [Vibrio jasicida]EGQ9743486.1 hypothetical protein [Vibrio parahaemolyticus]EJC7175976.1 hypothetical protein [Vibrio parahaemolyticus]EJE4724414.1 hypothetical protein [Vibrio parahaemolyticus]EJG0009708.1 hypothetical protein [Vibrio parahaemolyticus]